MAMRDGKNQMNEIVFLPDGDSFLKMNDYMNSLVRRNVSEGFLFLEKTMKSEIMIIRE